MVELVREEEVLALSKMVNDLLVGRPYVLSLKPRRHSLIVRAVAFDRAVDLKAFAKTGAIIFFTMPRCSVNQPRSVFHGDVISDNNGTSSFDKWVLIARLGFSKLLTGTETKGFDIRGLSALKNLF